MSFQVTKQATVMFEPISIESNFQKQFGIQIAFYRNDKIKQINPLKLNQPQKIIKFNQKDSIMKLHTTLSYNSQTDSIQTKIFKVQIIYKIDGVKKSLEKDIDISEYYSKQKQSYSFQILKKPFTELKYKVAIFFKDKEQIQKNKIKTQAINFQKQSASKSPFKNQNAKQKEHIDNGSKSIQKPILVNFNNNNNSKSLKIIKFSDDITQNTSIQLRSRKQIEVENTLNNNNYYEKQSKQTQIIKLKQKEITDLKQRIKLLEKNIDGKSKQLDKTYSKNSQIQTKFKQLMQKYQQINRKYNELKELSNSTTVNQQSLPNIKDLKQQIKQQRQINQKLQRQIQKLLKQSKQSVNTGSNNNQILKQKESQIKRLISQNKILQDQIRKGQSTIKALRQENKQLQDLLLQMQQKNSNINKNPSNNVKNLEESLKPYKQRIKLLEKQCENFQQQKNYSQKQLTTRNCQFQEVKQKQKSLNDQNLRHLQDLSNKQYQIEKLTKKIKDLEVQLKSNEKRIKGKLQFEQEEEQEGESEISQNGNKFKSEKFIGSGSSNTLSKLKAQNAELKTKLNLALKNLQNKENLLKKFDTFSKQDKKQLQQQLSSMKKQNNSLKQKLNSVQGSSSSSKGNTELGNLESRMQLQKTKKELQYKTKSQRQLLIDKSQLESRSKVLQQQVVKSKESIANILNVIHQFGDQGLIEEVNMFLG